MTHQIRYDDYIEHPISSQWDLSSDWGSDRAAALLTLSSRRAWKIQTRYEYVHTMPLFQHLVSELIPVTTTPLGFSKHSYLLPQDRCWLEYTLQSIICGPSLYRSQQVSWLSAKCRMHILSPMTCKQTCVKLHMCFAISNPVAHLEHQKAELDELASHSTTVPRLNRLLKLYWESQSQRAMTSGAFIFLVHASTLACITTVRFQSSEQGGGVNVAKYSTKRLISTCPLGLAVGVSCHMCVLKSHAAPFIGAVTFLSLLWGYPIIVFSIIIYYSLFAFV